MASKVLRKLVTDKLSEDIIFYVHSERFNYGETDLRERSSSHACDIFTVVIQIAKWFKVRNVKCPLKVI